MTYETADQSRPIVCFGSFQDYLGVDKTTGTIKGRNEWVHTINWDLVIFDEYHFGAWKENAKKLFEQDDEDDYDSENMEQYSRADATMKHGCLSPPTITCICPARPSVPQLRRVH